MCSRTSLTYVWLYTHINTRIQITNTRSCLSWARWRRNAPRAEPEKCFKALAAPTLVRGNRRADTRARTALGPYFSHKLMFCLLRMHNCASRATRSSLPCSPFRFPCLHRPDVGPSATTPPTWLISMVMTRNEDSNGYREREYTQCIPCTRHYPWTGYAPVTCYPQGQYSCHPTRDIFN